VHDRVTGATERVSVTADGSQSNGNAAPPSISADGTVIGFMSEATNLVPADGNATYDAFVREWGPAFGIGAIQATGNGSVQVSGWATFAGGVVTSGSDPPNDSTTGGGPLGGELTGVSLLYRPEQEDLLPTIPPTTLGSYPG